MNLKQIKKLEQTVQQNKETYLDLPSHSMLRDNILVYAIVFNEQDAIVTPQSYEDKPSYGIVVSVGPGRYLESGQLIPVSVSAGDFILFGKYGTTKERINGMDLYYIKDEDIISKLTI